MDIIPYGRQQITAADIAAVVEVLQSDYLTTGPVVEAFEEKFAAYVGAPYAVAVSSGTAALHLCMLAMNLSPGAKVLCPAITFAASANCVRYVGGELDFVDIDPVTFLLDIDALEEKLASAEPGHYDGVIAVDFAGYPVQMDRLYRVAQAHGLWIIEDACHAPGGAYQAEDARTHRCGDGAFADMAIFSFHPVKHLTTGEGGMITTAYRGLYERLRLLRNHGMTRDPGQLRENHGPWYYEIQELGFNYRLSAIHAALGLSQLDQAADNLAIRRAQARYYDEALAGLKSVVTPKVPSRVEHAYHLYVIQVEDRAGLYAHLHKQGIFAQVHYLPVPNLPYYRDLGHDPMDCPSAQVYYARALSLPLFPGLTQAEQDQVIEAVSDFCR